MCPGNKDTPEDYEATVFARMRQAQLTKQEQEREHVH